MQDTTPIYRMVVDIDYRSTRIYLEGFRHQSSDSDMPEVTYDHSFQLEEKTEYGQI